MNIIRTKILCGQPVAQRGRRGTRLTKMVNVARYTSDANNNPPVHRPNATLKMTDRGRGSSPSSDPGGISDVKNRDRFYLHSADRSQSP